MSLSATVFNHLRVMFLVFSRWQSLSGCPSMVELYFHFLNNGCAHCGLFQVGVADIFNVKRHDYAHIAVFCFTQKCFSRDCSRNKSACRITQHWQQCWDRLRFAPCYRFWVVQAPVVWYLQEDSYHLHHCLELCMLSIVYTTELPVNFRFLLTTTV